MNDWEKVKIEDIATLIAGFAFKSKDFGDFNDKVVKIKDIIPPGVDIINAEGVDLTAYSKERLQKYIIGYGDYLLAMTGATIGKIGRSTSTKPAYINQRVLKFSPIEGKCDKKFLYYVLHNGDFLPYILNHIDSQSVQPNISASSVGGYQFALPTLNIQHKIVKILSSLDDKIELNAQINHNLEEQAKCLVKSWFVDFEPYGGQIPDSWHEITLSEIADFIGGYSYKGAELQPSSCAMATIKNFDRTGGFKLDGYKEIIPSDKLKDSQKVELFDILVAHTDLTQKAEVIGNAEMVLSKSGYDEIIMSMDLVKVLPKHGISRFVLAALLRTDQFKDHALGYVNGTTVLHMSKKALPAFTLYFPEKFSELSEISCMLEAIYKKIAQNIEESRSLVKLRDTLLPKLMSGEIDVSEVEI